MSTPLGKAFWLSWGLVTLVTVGCVVRLALGPQTLEEKDRAVALRDERRARIQRAMSEGFYRRAFRRAIGVMRLGEQRRVKCEKQSQAN